MGPEFVNVGEKYGGWVTRAEYERILNARIRENFRSSPAPSAPVPYESRLVNINGQWVTHEQVSQLREQAFAETRRQAAQPNTSPVPYEQRTINFNGQQVTPAQLTQMRDAAIRETWRNAASPPQVPSSSIGPLNSTALPGGGGSLSTPINRGAVPTAPVNLAPSKTWTALPPLEPAAKPPIVRIPQGAGGNLGPALGALSTASALPGLVSQALGDYGNLQGAAFAAGRNLDRPNLGVALAQPFTAPAAIAGLASNIPKPANIPDWAWPFPEPLDLSEFPPEAAGAGPIIEPGTPPPFTGGQSVGVCYRVNVSGGDGATSSFTTRGPIGGVRTVTISGGGRLEVFSRSIPGPPDATNCTAQFNPAWWFTGDGGTSWNADKTASITSITRVDGQPDTGGDPPGGAAPVRDRNPYRPNGTDGAGNPRTLPAPTNTEPEPSPEQLPWPQTPTPAQPSPLDPINPSAANDTPEGFSPMPSGDPGSADQTDAPPQEESTPDNPTETAPKLAPTIIPIVLGAGAAGLAARSGSLSGGSPFLTPVNRSNSSGLVETPVKIPSENKQPVLTPSGPQIGTPPSDNPNLETTDKPVVIQPTTPSSCCIPPPDPEIIKRLEQIKTGIGVDGMPVSVPDQIAKDNPGQLMIGSLAELHLWQVQQLDGVLGKWPVGIPIPTPAGTTTVGMPNMAEAVAEIVGMLVSQQVTAAQILNTSSRAMVQAGSATQQAHLAHLVAKANADFLGYESRPSAVNMPLTYSPGKDLSDGLLNESTAQIKGFENTDNTDIKAILAELLQAAAIIRAVYWRKLDARGDIKTQLRQNIRGQGDFIDKAAAGDGNDSDWEEYLRQVAEGFRGVTGDANPYGRPPTEGPQIKDRSPGEGKK